MRTKKDKREKLLDERRSFLKTQSKQNLILRRSLLEIVIRSLQEQGKDWKTAILEDEEHFTLEEQYNLIDEALLNLDSDLGPVVNLKPGLVDLKTFKFDGE